MQKNVLNLNGFNFKELFTPDGLLRLDQHFLSALQSISPDAYSDLLAYRQNENAFTKIQISELLLAVAPILDQFLVTLFGIEEAAALQEAKTLANNPVAAFKKFFVLRKAKKLMLQMDSLPSFASLNAWLQEQLAKAPLKTDDLELAISLLANQYIAAPEQHSDEIQRLTQWCAHALYTPDAQPIVRHFTSFRIPKRIDYDALVDYTTVRHDPLKRVTAPSTHLQYRDGFKLTDPRMSAREVQDEVNYCIYCHDHDGDFCSKGFPAKKDDPSLGLKKNPLDITLTGCPLDEKISEMHVLKRDGKTIAALAMIMVDNPMCPATGHRICNDCMKACVYQKQEPVNIPQVETRILTDALNLPWGVEIYDLLTRWNPLRQSQWAMKPYNGLKVMIAGMGPAGFTLAHHLLLEGFAVVGFDGLKIEPLDQALLDQPIYRFDDLKESLDERLIAGFGGVAEYGITVRWDKNFLKLIYISLMRRPLFQVFGSTRFGGTITIDDAWEMGFDHFVVAVGAGLPKALPIPGSLAPGMRQANDFLMTLQLGNAAKKDSLTNLQVRLPAVVIGGGLTGVDTATEVQAYYIAQVEKILDRYEQLVAYKGEDAVLNPLDPASREILDEFLAHGKAVRTERRRAIAEHRQPNFIKLIHEWGGVTIVYRRTMQESPAYTHNHEELNEALQEGVFYLDAYEPARVLLNAFGHSETLVCHKRVFEDDQWTTLTDEIRIPARSIFVATGTQPNIAYEFEHRGTFNRLGFQYQHYEETPDGLTIAHGIAHCKEPDFGPFTSYIKDDYRVSLIGDTHPVFHGNVVKAIASGMRTYPKILASLQRKLGQLGDVTEYQTFRQHIEHLFTATLKTIQRRTESVVEITVHAPLAARHFKPGQFYRLQNYETFAKRVDHTSLQMEPLALVAANADLINDTLKFIIIENGTSSKLCAALTPGDPISLMGPTGVRAKISHENETILIIGNPLSMPLLESYGTALRQAGNRVIYLGHFTTKDELYCQTELESCADMIIWATHQGELIQPNRPGDYSASGDAVEVLLRYAKGKLHTTDSEASIPLSDIDRIYVIGDTTLLRRFQDARKNELATYLIKNPTVYGSVYSTMQCMLKGVCAQCLQWQVDPETGQRTKAVFACSWPEQPLELIDFDNIDERQIQNQLQEHISNQWIDYVFNHYSVQKV